MARYTTERGFDRVVFFSDATVAIALTLLVLPLADLASEADDVGAWALLSDHRDAIVAFLVSFVVIALVWLEHHRLFESLANYGTTLLLLNFVWLFAVVALPFSTEVNQEAPTADRTAVGLYIGNLLLAFVATALMRLTAVRDPRLIQEQRREEFDLAPSLILVALCALALVVAVGVPKVGMWALLLLALAGPVERLLRRVRRTG